MTDMKSGEAYYIEYRQPGFGGLIWSMVARYVAATSDRMIWDLRPAGLTVVIESNQISEITSRYGDPVELPVARRE